ncbi:hypothetical protein BU17DRAFT_65309 [Hysterangium stoloniferum]|nr:hypothetical protein BU17DRAFT_103380 [Hysterangium stoloniferum]KAF8520617.1 hypothetical protein BU17DRAFT_65309 [Hysterangium stoloniferum]
MSPFNLIAQNTFSSIEIEGLVKKNDQTAILTCQRGSTLPANLQYDSYGEARPDGFWVRPPSNFPAPSNGILRVTVNDQLGRGRIGTVYSVDVKSPRDGPHIPPLVIKVSNRYRSPKLAREAWFYEEMEHLQGVCIARCYGFFQVELTEEYEVPNWRRISEEVAEEADEEERCSLRDSVWSQERAIYFAKVKEDTPDSASNKVIDTIEDWEDLVQEELSCYTPDPAAHLTFVRKHHLISVLVLERLGEHIPIGIPLEGIRQDIHDLYDDLGRLGIEAVDVHWRNILGASGTSERLVCPYHDRTHAWRLIDFDLAKKTDKLPEWTASSSHSLLKIIFLNLVEGTVIGWD